MYTIGPVNSAPPVIPAVAYFSVSCLFSYILLIVELSIIEGARRVLVERPRLRPWHLLVALRCPFIAVVYSEFNVSVGAFNEI